MRVSAFRFVSINLQLPCLMVISNLVSYFLFYVFFAFHPTKMQHILITAYLFVLVSSPLLVITSTNYPASHEPIC